MAKSHLTERKLQSKLRPDRYYDKSGNGLHLLVRVSGSKSWVQRLRINGKYRDLGLGGYPAVSLAAARQIAYENKASLLAGNDPRISRTKAQHMPSFGEVASNYLAIRVKELRNVKHQNQWYSTINTYVMPHIGKYPIDKIEPHQIRDLLVPIWEDKHETARRVRSRIEAVFNHAIALKLISSPNPASWKGNLEALLPSKIGGKASNPHPALQLRDAASWWNNLCLRDGMGASALQFLALTAVRSGDVRGMRWSEIHQDNTNANNQTWIIPTSRRKTNLKDVRVPITPFMQSLLYKIPRHKTSDLVFFSSKGTMLSDMTLSELMKRMHTSQVQQDGIGYVDAISKKPAVPHGLRSLFTDWAAENGYDFNMAEMQLTHAVGNQVTRAYLRTDMVEKRRTMMAAYGDFLLGKDNGQSPSQAPVPLMDPR